MKVIELYNMDEAEADIEKDESGFTCSIKKWESMVETVSTIKAVVHEQCGLCIERDECNAQRCEGCPLESEDPCYPEWKEACLAINNVDDKVWDMLHRLNGIARR